MSCPYYKFYFKGIFSNIFLENSRIPRFSIVLRVSLSLNHIFITMKQTLNSGVKVSITIPLWAFTHTHTHTNHEFKKQNLKVLLCSNRYVCTTKSQF